MLSKLNDFNKTIQNLMSKNSSLEDNLTSLVDEKNSLIDENDKLKRYIKSLEENLSKRKKRNLL